jgi:crotonobetaine/carnitine-CoA ligase
MQSSITPHVIAERAERTPDDVLLEEIDGPTLSYGEFHDLCLRWADVLDRLAVAPGDSVANAASGAPAYWTWLGASWRGARHIPINPELRGRLLVEALEVTGATTFVVPASMLEPLTAVAPELTRLTTVVVLGPTPDDPTGAAHLTVLDADALLAQALPRPRQHPGPESVHTAVFTSGTTGASKCAERSWEMIEAGGRWMMPGDIDSRLPGGGYYSPWPVFHGMALSGLAVAVQRQLRLVVRRKFSLSSFWDDIRKYRCSHATLLVVAPLIYGRPSSPDDRDNPLRYVTIVPLMKDFQLFEQRFDVTVSTMYGQSETGPVLAAPAPTDYRVAGRPIPGMDVAIIDDEGRFARDGETGELVVRPNGGHTIARDYVGAPGAMAARLREGGWFRTGDAFRRDDSGEFRFVDRLKDYIRHRGHNLSSSELEREILSHPHVADCAVVGMPSELADADMVGDEDVKAVVVRAPGTQLDGAELVRFLEPRVPSYMLPSCVEFVDELPRTPTFKVRKAALRAGVPGSEVWQRLLNEESPRQATCR